jgi:hypothetical protein
MIPVPVNVFPYKDMRRNVKLLKMYAGLVIFSFSERIIWQDAKLWKKDWIQDSPTHSNYRKLFGENVDKYGACVSFRALPNDAAAVGWTRKGGPRFRYHCHTLETVDRPGVTDDREIIRKQCDYYQGLHNDSYRTSLDSGMVDSAFILWDMRGARCLDFNTKLTCTWLGEIQCFGDRDQVSFAQALRSMGVYQPHPTKCKHSMSKDKLFVGGDDPATPLVHIGRGNCHWYYASHARNMFTCGSNPVAIAAGDSNVEVRSLMLDDGNRAWDYTVKALNERIQTASRRLAAEYSVLETFVLAAGGAALVALLTLVLRSRASVPEFDNLPHQPPSDAPRTHEPVVVAAME